MAWFKVDDTLPLNPKVRSCSLAAIGLWTVAGAWASQQLTNGIVPKQMLQALASAGLWIAHADSYEFHDWKEYQPDKETYGVINNDTKHRQGEHSC